MDALAPSATDVEIVDAPALSDVGDVAAALFDIVELPPVVSDAVDGLELGFRVRPGQKGGGGSRL